MRKYFGQKNVFGNEHTITRLKNRLDNSLIKILQASAILPGAYQIDPHQRDLVLIEQPKEVIKLSTNGEHV